MSLQRWTFSTPRHSYRFVLPASGEHCNNGFWGVDIQPNNILLGIKDESILSGFEEWEMETPVPRKVLQDRPIYLSRPLPISYGTPVLCDLGEARVGIEGQHGDIMPDLYRAPEVILNMEWDYKVDIWSVGMVVRLYCISACRMS